MLEKKKGVDVRVDPSSWSIEEWKQVATVYTEADRQICPTPCFLFSVFATGYKNDNGVAILYDGHAAVGDPKYRIRIAATDSKFFEFNVPVYFTKGMYLDILDHCDAVTIQYLPWNP